MPGFPTPIWSCTALPLFPRDWLEIIRANGGTIKETYGVPVEEIVEAIKYGVRKVNIDTDIRLAMTGAMRQLM
ncbi:Ketose-bisphosphate aldolase, class-II, partial [mine drainage metagenome]